MYVVQGDVRLPEHVPKVKFSFERVKEQLPVPQGPAMLRLLGCQVKMSLVSGASLR